MNITSIAIGRRGRSLAIAMGMVAAASVVPQAHHSFSVFNMQTEATITGTVKQVDWTNPHIWIWVEVKNTTGGTDTYGFEGMSPNYLARRGWTRGTLKPGDEITVLFRPLRDGSPGGMFVSTTTPDGKALRMFGSPTGQ